VLAEIGRARRVVLSIGNFFLLPSLLRCSDMIAVIPERLAQDVPGLLKRRPPLPIPGFTFYALWHESTHADPARAWARSLLFKAAEALSIPSEF
jgi:DNA-binding transcriptional LysR family regulator